MISIHVTFVSFARVHVGDLFGLTGVYVIWDNFASGRPSCIGEGNFLERFAWHSKTGVRKFTPPIRGYVGFVEENPKCSIKDAGCVIERLLLDVAGRTERSTATNKHPGDGSLVKLFCQEGIVRVTIKGCDPLSPASTATPLRNSKMIRAEPDRDGNYLLDHSWRLRRSF